MKRTGVLIQSCCRQSRRQLQSTQKTADKQPGACPAVQQDNRRDSVNMREGLAVSPDCRFIESVLPTSSSEHQRYRFVSPSCTARYRRCCMRQRRTRCSVACIFVGACEERFGAPRQRRLSYHSPVALCDPGYTIGNTHTTASQVSRTRRHGTVHEQCDHAAHNT